MPKTPKLDLGYEISARISNIRYTLIYLKLLHSKNYYNISVTCIRSSLLLSIVSALEIRILFRSEEDSLRRIFSLDSLFDGNPGWRAFGTFRRPVIEF